MKAVATMKYPASKMIVSACFFGLCLIAPTAAKSAPPRVVAAWSQITGQTAYPRPNAEPAVLNVHMRFVVSAAAGGTLPAQPCDGFEIMRRGARETVAWTARTNDIFKTAAICDAAMGEDWKSAGPLQTSKATSSLDVKN